MLDLTKKKMRDSVEIGGVYYPVRTDFRYWLCFARTLRGARLPDEFDFMYEGDPPADRGAGIAALAEFYDPPTPLPRPDGSAGGKVVDFEQDADLIAAAFMEQYGIDLTEKDLHWHKFLALFRGLHGTKLNEVMGYRCHDEGDRTDYKRYMARMKSAWALEEELTESERAAVERFDGEFS